MRIAITGTGGRVGTALARALSCAHEVIPLERGSLDLADTAVLKRGLEGLDCDVFINPAGLTGLEQCEDDPGMAMRVNAEAPGVIAAWAVRCGVRMIHFSTDYVLDGCSPGLHHEDEAPGPLSVYGRSKLAGERAVLAFPGHLVIRVSWVFGPEKPSFLDQVLEAALSSHSLAAVADKFSLPTYTGDLAGWMMRILDSDVSGVLHACNSGGPVSWHGMAEELVRQALRLGILEGRHEVAAQKLEEVSAFRAKRPRHTAMGTERLQKVLGQAPQNWKAALQDYLVSYCVIEK